jgi:hypothetical protein
MKLKLSDMASDIDILKYQGSGESDTESVFLLRRADRIMIQQLLKIVGHSAIQQFSNPTIRQFSNFVILGDRMRAK